MAIVTGTWVGTRGSIAGLTFRQLDGVTIVSQRSKPRDTRSRAKMWRRCQWNNVMSMYKVLGLDLLDTFEECRTKRNTCNRYVHLNLERTPLFLTREQKALNACVLAPHQVSEGSLPAIGHRIDDNNLVCTDIKLSADLDANTTVAALSEDIVSLNPAFRYGDTLMLCRLRQAKQEVEGAAVPLAEKQTFRLKLSRTDTRSLLPDGRLQLCRVDGVLALAVPLDYEAACFIHLRQHVSGALLASSQQLMCVNPLMESYSSEEAFRQSAQSYGGIERTPYLQPAGSQQPEAAAAAETSSLVITRVAPHSSIVTQTLTYYQSDSLNNQSSRAAPLLRPTVGS